MAEFLKKWKKYFTIAALFSCFVNILQLTFPFYMFTIYNNVVLSYSSYSLANITTAAFLAVAALGAFSYLRSRILASAGADLNLITRERVFFTTIKGRIIDSKNWYQGGMNDIESLRNFFSSPAINALFDVPWSPFYIALIYLIHPVMGLIATSGAVIVVVLSGLQEVLTRKNLHDANRINGFNQRFVDSFLRNTEVINGMGMIGTISERFVNSNDRVLINQTRSSNRASVIQAVIKPLQNVIQVLIYCSGAYYGITEGFNVGLMVAASIIMGRGLGPLIQFMSAWQSIHRARESYVRLDTIISQQERLQSQTMSLSLPKGRLIFEGVRYRVHDRMLLEGISFALQPGEFLGVIGPSGAGKTTLCRLLLGIMPPLEGRVTLDGKDIYTWDKEQIGRTIGYLPQEIELFPGTVAETIARLDRKNDQDICRSLELCGIREMVERLPQGLETILEGEDGLRLSGGQKQRIGLARAVYGNPSLLVLDEPTSNLDEAGEQQFLAALAQIKKQQTCTCVMVTHKPSLLQQMDKILMLRDGHMVLFGARDTVFAALTKQAGKERIG